ncbi:hypothetical protein C2E21_2269 [Chlorella sorokiniana]|uniref:Uncharacterized protein n=1 Tax=Chlorella sorokiniana TaxID=3076 RepID=A0A2P6TZ76_CHLSO|nr:hypothetical protein C2E21_2269 [Chlorella sorokiniana]|eukprot:PRW59369.1 hypothetical protein C2E21_2269 [Chlorella sorokiniana]
MAKPDENEPALPWALRPLPLGTGLEVEIEGGWVEVEVAEAHGQHQYTLVVLTPDDEDGAAAAAAGAAAAAEAQGAEGEEQLAMRVRIVSDSQLEILDSDGSVPEEGGGVLYHWRRAPDNIAAMFSNAFKDLARRQPLPKGVQLPSADDMAALMAQKLAELVQRSVAHTAEAGSQVVEVDSVFAAMAGMATEMGMPGAEERVRQQMQEQKQREQQQQQQQHGEEVDRQQRQQQEQQQEGEGAEEAEDGRPPGKKARKSS